MALNSQEAICNLALNTLGDYGTIENLDTPTTAPERTFALWIDTCRKLTLKYLMPNFSHKRLKVSQLVETPVFGYTHYYEYPNTALKILGVGEIQDKKNNYTIERTPSGVKAIAHDTDYTSGMPLRIVYDVTDINSWSEEAKVLFADYLAAYTCKGITQDAAMARDLKNALPDAMSAASGLNAQENIPIRISNSRFKAARYSDNPNFTSKK
jgi:hypothetical protein